jgi:hypothetical protein
MSLCLLSRGLQNFVLSIFGFCFRPSKAMIALLFDSGLLQSTSSTPQPRQQKGLCRKLSSTPWLIPKHSISQVAASLYEIKDLLIAGGSTRNSRRTFAAPRTHSFLSAGSPDHSVLSANVLPDDGLCLVCCAHSSASCPVCEQDFCSNHLYVCRDCDNQFCGSCLDDHRADGHWTDSDTNAELSHGWRASLVSGQGNSEAWAFVRSVKNPFFSAVHIVKASSDPAFNRSQGICNDPFAYQSHSSIIGDLPNGKAIKARGDGFRSSPAGCNYCAVYDTFPDQAFARASRARNRSSSRISHPEPLRQATSCFARVMRAVCSCVAAQNLVNLFSQFQSLEVCL